MIRKTSDNSIASVEAFSYDAAGNVTSAPDSSFQYDTNNRLISFNGNTVSYDLDGNMLSSSSLTCTYDSANRLVSAGGHTYTYNAEDVRIRNLCSDADTKYTYDTSSKLSKLLCKTTNGITTKYVYGRGLIGEEKCGEFKTYHFDSRGSTVAITDAIGNITDTFAYDTYGKLISRTGTSFVIFGYNGRDGVITDKNGLIYMRARYYSPDMKRFVNADIVAGKISNAVTLNRFAYANGNPVSLVDPFGLAPSRSFSQTAGVDGGGGGISAGTASSSSGNDGNNAALQDQLNSIFNNVTTSEELRDAYIEAVNLISNTSTLFEWEAGVKITLLDTGNTKVYFEIITSPSTEVTNNSTALNKINEDTLRNSIKAVSESEVGLGLNSVSTSDKIKINDNMEILISQEVEPIAGGVQYSLEGGVSCTDDNNNSTEYVIGVEHTLRKKIQQHETVLEYEIADGREYSFANIKKKIKFPGTYIPNDNVAPVVITAAVAMVICVGAMGGSRVAQGGMFDRTCILTP